jgi:hypothetical protein
MVCLITFRGCGLWLTTCSTILPDGLKDETLRTLALLFPERDQQTRVWLNKQSSRFDATLFELRSIANRRSADRKVSFLARSAGHAEARFRSVAACNPFPVVVRQAQRRAVVYLLGCYLGTLSYSLLRYGAEHRRGVAGVQSISPVVS